MPVRSDISKHFVAARMHHRFCLGELAPVLAFADGGVVRSEFAHGTVPDQIKARIAHVADHHLVVLHDGQGQDAGHAAPGFIPLR